MLKFGQSSSGFYATTLVITNSPIPFTFSSFCKWLNESGYNDSNNSIENNNKRYFATGANATAYVQMISSPNGSSIYGFGNPWCQNHATISSANYFTDTVQQIL